MSIDNADLEHYRLEQRVKSGANWFYWIAALSVINSLSALSGSTWSFAIGLGFTGVLDAFVGSELLWLRLIGLGLHLWLLAAFIALGYTARRRSGAFTIGMVVYGLDALLCLAFQVWMATALHAFALVSIWGGRAALRRLTALGLPPESAETPPSSSLLATTASAPVLSLALDPRPTCQSCGTVLLGDGPLCVRCQSRST